MTVTKASFPAFHPYPTQDTELLQHLQYLPGLKELLILRQVHALEHATVWVLGELRSRQSYPRHASQADDFGGLSTDQGFYLYGSVATATLQRAVKIALRRLIQGDWNLAIHPRCGTNLSVGMTLATSFALGLHIFLPKGIIEQILGLSLAAAAATQLTPELGAATQRYITTAIPFNLVVDQVIDLSAQAAQPTHFVKIHWLD
jgi:hypothetical protein